MPSGVDAQSWIGFEQRVQERRFKALVETATAAIARRDGGAARAALEEARELRPGSPELNALSARVASLPLAQPSPASSNSMWYRALGAVAMFGVGVGLVMGLESFRAGLGEPAPAAVLASAETPATTVPDSIADTTNAPAPTPDALPVEPSADEPAPEPVAVSSPPPRVAPETVPRAREEAPRTREEPVRIAAAPRPTTVDTRPAAVPNRPSVRPPVEAPVNRGGQSPAAVVQTSRETPDDFVAASPRNESRPAFTETPAAQPAPSIAASVMPQPVSVTAAPPAAPAATTAAGGTAITSRGDNTRVAQVLNQYARAYGSLDSSAARAVWPTVDERALSRAFASLESQDVSFERCDIDVKGNLASASCRGTASYVGKVGSRQARTEARQWNFELKLHGDDWKIEKAQAVAR